MIAILPGNHILNISVVKFLKHVRRFLKSDTVDIETLKSVYYALVHSYLRYGIVVWGNAIETECIKPLNSLLDRVVRIMTFAPFRINTGPIFNFLKFLNMLKLKLWIGNFM